MVFVSLSSKLTYNHVEPISVRIRESLDRIEKSGRKIRPGDTVAVKVNIVIPARPEQAVCTDPRLLVLLLAELQTRGARVRVCEDCLDDSGPEVSGILEVTRRTGTEFVNLRENPWVEITRDGSSYHYFRDILEADYLISVPRLKTHLYTYYTGAIKNMYGCIRKEQRKSLHRDMAQISGFVRHLVNIYAIRRPDLILLDAITSMEGMGPTHGRPKDSGLLLISNDGVMADFYATTLMGYQPLELDTVRIAFEQGLHRSSPEDVFFPDEKPTELTIGTFNKIPVLQEEKRQKYLHFLCGPIIVNRHLCVRCGICRDCCPFHAIKMDDFPMVDRQACQYCFCCLELCPGFAIMPKNFHVL